MLLTTVIVFILCDLAQRGSPKLPKRKAHIPPESTLDKYYMQVWSDKTLAIVFSKDYYAKRPRSRGFQDTQYLLKYKDHTHAIMKFGAKAFQLSLKIRLEFGF